MFNAIHHVAIICSDYPRSKRFYTEVLGLTVIAENYREARDSYKLDLALPDGSQVELFSFPEAQGLRHLAFQVDDVEYVKEYLEAREIEVEPIRIDEFTGKAFTFFKDPDGLPLEVYQC
ncbi:SMU1112c/YaeR family gloxylase I-like metalloprotein [Vibrio diabolicus]|uniref:SMU1112c/YaeR family gloxylase I-like metalloprotein n=1 Tax=Vibrio diabolicus TaxID=50719 RepID=UPI003753C5B9